MVRPIALLMICACVVSLYIANFTEADAKARSEQWTELFEVEPGELSSVGRNPYFVLEPGYQLYYENAGDILTITVLDETRVVDGVETRVVEEREIEDGELIEVSRNYFAISTRTNSVFYFGEEVDIYRDGKIINHEGAWLSGEYDARFGLIMPGQALIGSRYYQEIAPGIAMDRAEVVAVNDVLATPAGEFKGCLRTVESTPLDPKEHAYKLYAPGVGLIKDGSMLLVRSGKVQ